MVLGESSTPMTAKVMESLDDIDSIPGFDSRPAPTAATAPEPTIRTAESSMEEDDTMSYFAKLAAED